MADEKADWKDLLGHSTGCWEELDYTDRQQLEEVSDDARACHLSDTETIIADRSNEGDEGWNLQFYRNNPAAATFWDLVEVLFIPDFT